MIGYFIWNFKAQQISYLFQSWCLNPTFEENLSLVCPRVPRVYWYIPHWFKLLVTNCEWSGSYFCDCAKKCSMYPTVFSLEFLKFMPKEFLFVFCSSTFPNQRYHLSTAACGLISHYSNNSLVSRISATTLSGSQRVSGAFPRIYRQVNPVAFVCGEGC